MRRRVIVVHTILTRQYPATIIPDDYAQCPPNRTRDPARRGPRSIRRFSLLMIDPMNKYADRPYIKNRAIVGRPAWGRRARLRVHCVAMPGRARRVVMTHCVMVVHTSRRIPCNDASRFGCAYIRRIPCNDASHCGCAYIRRIPCNDASRCCCAHAPTHTVQ